MPSRVQFLCDVCFDNDEHVDGETRTVTIGSLARSIILCDDHDAHFLKPLRETLQEFGVRIAANGSAVVAAPRRDYKRADLTTRVPLPDGVTADEAQAAADQGECFYPGCTYHGPSRGHLAPHLRGKHDVTLTMLGLSQKKSFEPGNEAAQLAAERRPRQGTGGVCPECGDVFETGQGLAVHRSKRHGVAGGSRQAVKVKAASRLT